MVTIKFDINFVSGFLKGIKYNSRISFAGINEAKSWVIGVQLRLIDGEKYYNNFSIIRHEKVRIPDSLHLDILNAYDNGIKVKELADKYNVSQARIYQIISKGKISYPAMEYNYY